MASKKGIEPLNKEGSPSSQPTEAPADRDGFPPREEWSTSQALTAAGRDRTKVEARPSR